MLTEELIELANKVCKQKAEEQTIELKFQLVFLRICGRMGSKQKVAV